MASGFDELIVRVKLAGANEAAAEARVVSAAVEGIGGAAKKADVASASAFSRIGRRMDTVGSKMASTGKKMQHTFTTPIVAAVGASAYLAADFQRNMELIHTQAGASQKEVAKSSRQILGLASSGQTAQTPVELSKALYRLEGAGLRGAKAMRALRASSDLAAVGNANVEDTAKTLSQAWFVGIKGAGGFKNTVAQLNATVGAGDLRLQQLVDALGTGVLASAKQAGLGMKDVTGALAVFGDETNNVSGWSAQFATALHFLYAPGNKAADAMNAMGLKTHQLSEDMAKPHGLVRALGDLRSHLDALPGGRRGTQAKDLLSQILPGGRGRVLLVLLNQLDRLKKKQEQIAGTTKDFGEAVKKTNDQPMVKFHKSLAQLEAAGIRLGNAVLPALTRAVSWLAGAVSKAANWFSHLSKGQQHAIEYAALFVAATGPVLRIVGNLTRVFGIAFKAVGLFGRGLGLLARTRWGARIVSAIATPLGKLGAKMAPALRGATSALGGWARTAGSMAGRVMGGVMLTYLSSKLADWAHNNGLSGSKLGNTIFPLSPHGQTPKFATNHSLSPQAFNQLNNSVNPHVRTGTHQGTAGHHGPSTRKKVATGDGTAMEGDTVIHVVNQLDGQTLWESWHRQDRKKRNRR